MDEILFMWHEYKKKLCKGIYCGFTFPITSDLNICSSEYVVISSAMIWDESLPASVLLSDLRTTAA